MSNKIDTYSPFLDIHQEKFKIHNAIIVKINKKDNLCINNYIIHRLIGRGSYAQVRQAYDVFNEEDVALRIVNRRQISKKLNPRKCDQLIANHLKILQILDCAFIIQLKEYLYTNIMFYDMNAKIKTIPISHELAKQFEYLPQIIGNLVPELEYDDEPSISSETPRHESNMKNLCDSCVFVFELAQSTLEKELPRIDYDTLRKHLYKAAQCLQHMHEQRIQYNDLKPDNLLIINDQVKCSDFDTSIILDENNLNYCSLQQLFSLKQLKNTDYIITDPLMLTQDYVRDIVCTPAIASPEVRRKHDMYGAFQSDVWQYGQLLIRCLLGSTANQQVLRFSQDYNLIKQLYGEDLADMIAGCTDQQALRYSATQIVQHSYFTKIDLQQFHIKVINQKRKQMFHGCNSILRSSSALEKQSQSAILTKQLIKLEQFILRINMLQNIINKNSNTQYSFQLKNFKIIDITFKKIQQKWLFMSNQRSKSVCRCKNLNDQIQLSNLVMLMDQEAVDIINQCSYQQQITDYVDVKLFENVQAEELKQYIITIQYFNILIRYANIFNTKKNILHQQPETSMNNYIAAEQQIKKYADKYISQANDYLDILDNNSCKKYQFKQRSTSYTNTFKQMHDSKTSLFSDKEAIISMNSSNMQSTNNDQNTAKLQPILKTKIEIADFDKQYQKQNIKESSSFDSSEPDLPCKYVEQKQTNLLLNVKLPLKSDQPEPAKPVEMVQMSKLNLNISNNVKQHKSLTSQTLPLPDQLNKKSYLLDKNVIMKIKQNSSIVNNFLGQSVVLDNKETPDSIQNSNDKVIFQKHMLGFTIPKTNQFQKTNNEITKKIKDLGFKLPISTMKMSQQQTNNNYNGKYRCNMALYSEQVSDDQFVSKPNSGQVSFKNLQLPASDSLKQNDYTMNRFDANQKLSKNQLSRKQTDFSQFKRKGDMLENLIINKYVNLEESEKTIEDGTKQIFGEESNQEQSQMIETQLDKIHEKSDSVEYHVSQTGNENTRLNQLKLGVFEEENETQYLANQYYIRINQTTERICDVQDMTTSQKWQLESDIYEQVDQNMGRVSISDSQSPKKDFTESSFVEKYDSKQHLNSDALNTLSDPTQKLSDKNQVTNLLDVIYCDGVESVEMTKQQYSKYQNIGQCSSDSSLSEYDLAQHDTVEQLKCDDARATVVQYNVDQYANTNQNQQTDILNVIRCGEPQSMVVDAQQFNDIGYCSSSSSFVD